MAQGEFITINCPGSTSNYACTGTFPNGQVINLCGPINASFEKCNQVPLDKGSCSYTVNDDYSVTFNFPVPATSKVYPLSYYTCENFLNQSLAVSEPTPSISKVTIYIFTNDTGVNQTIEITDPAELVLSESGDWIYTTDPCQFNMYGQYIITVIVSWDMSTAVTTNDFNCWSDNLFTWSYSDRPGIGYTVNANGYVIGGTPGTYDPAANCPLVQKPNGKGQGKGKKPRV